MVSRTLGLKAISGASVLQLPKQDAVSWLTAYLLCLLVIPSDLVFGPLGGAGNPATIVGAFFFLAYLFRLLASASSPYGGSVVARLTPWLFLCAVLASYIAANLHELTITQQNAADRGLVSVAGFLGILFLTGEGINTFSRLEKLLERIVWGGTALALVGIIQFFTAINLASYITVPGLTLHQPYSDLNLRGSYNRPQATTAQPLEFSFVVALVLPIAIHRAMYAPAEKRAFRWAQVALIGLTIPLTVARSAFIGLAVIGLVLLPVWSYRDRLIALAVTALAFAGVEVAVPGLLHEVENLFLAIGSDSSTTSRTGAFPRAAPLISQHIFFGSGLGTFDPHIYFFTDDEYLNALIEIGFVGMITLAAVYITGWVTARRARRKSNNPEVRHLAQCLAASCAVIICVSGTFDQLSFPMATGMSFLILGCTAALYRLVHQTEVGRL